LVKDGTVKAKKEKINRITYEPIGVIHSPFVESKGTPIQPGATEGITGTVEVFPQYAAGLKDIEGFSHLILLYHLHRAKGSPLLTKPFMDDEVRGIFAIRGPSRPNPIGISVVRLMTVENNILHIQDVDILNGTPLLDIKPYVPEFDARETERIGWLEKRIHRVSAIKDNGRFGQ
jgi:tRNA-Thr(GGU) m(6)t(6)A37 methyltransferase TsaA